jgi:hypothetical protein
MSGPCLFVSYSHKDGKWLEALRTQLEPLELDCDLWHDQRIVPGDRWHREIESALRAAQAAIFLVSPDFLESAFIREHELPALLNGAESRGLRVLCLHVRPSVLAGTGRLKDVYERLRRFQALNDPDRPLSRLSKARQDKALAEIAADIQRAVAPFPVAATPPADSVTPVAFRNMPHGSPDGVFLGRDVELRLLDDAWADTAHTQVVALVAAGGVGKTALVQEWLQRLRADGWRGASRVYAWSFFSQGTSDDRQASDDVFLSEALAWFGVPHEATESAADKGRLLGEELSHQRVLLLLDGVEPLQYPPGPLGGRLRAPGVEALLDRIARVGAPGLVVVTTREALTDLSDCQRNADRPAGTVVAHDVSNLAEVDGARALHRLGVRKAGPAQVAEDDDELRAASREVRGHALTLSLLGKYLALVHDGNVRRRDSSPLPRSRRRDPRRLRLPRDRGLRALAEDRRRQREARAGGRPPAGAVRPPSRSRLPGRAAPRTADRGTDGSPGRPERNAVAARGRPSAGVRPAAARQQRRAAGRTPAGPRGPRAPPA